jgi:hypothetical protein
VRGGGGGGGLLTAFSRLPTWAVGGAGVVGHQSL